MWNSDTVSVGSVYLTIMRKRSALLMNREVVVFYRSPTISGNQASIKALADLTTPPDTRNVPQSGRMKTVTGFPYTIDLRSVNGAWKVTSVRQIGGIRCQSVPEFRRASA